LNELNTKNFNNKENIREIKFENNVQKFFTTKIYKKFFISDTKDLIKFSKNIKNALLNVHSERFLHLDIKPSNILKDGDSYILNDFG
jgi:serine/threonine protein kinase